MCAGYKWTRHIRRALLIKLYGSDNVVSVLMDDSRRLQFGRRRPASDVDCGLIKLRF